ncbi:MAG: Crp/Fnr family transcriptional regulator [Armatimonadetes bacterium]|nr:Crp/Fnr family transcriptional regulator [Armatimonadota bacterium]
MPDPVLTDFSSIPERPTKASVLQACTLLNPLTEAQREDLIESSFMAYAERGELIWHAGSPAEYAAIIGVGFIKMTKLNPSGQEMAVELLGPGQCLGLMVVLEGRSFPLSALAATHCWYMKASARNLIAAYQANDKLKDQVVRNLGPRLRRAHDMMSRLSSGKVEQRIAAILFILADSYGARNGHAINIQVPLTRQDIAEMAGTTTETSIRVLSKWQKEGVVATDKHLISILDEAKLTEVMSQ